MAQSEAAQDHTLKLTAYDYDGPHRSPDFLGQLRVPLGSLLNNRPDIKATEKTWCVLHTPHSATSTSPVHVPGTESGSQCKVDADEHVSRHDPTWRCSMTACRHTMSDQGGRPECSFAAAGPITSLSACLSA